MSNPWQQVFENYRTQIEEGYITEKYGQHKSDEAEETQALYDLRNKMKNMGKESVVAYLKRSKMAPERKSRLAKALGLSIVEGVLDEKITAKTDIGTAIKDFQSSTDSRLAGRSQESRQKAAIAAVLTARRGGKKLAKEEVDSILEAKAGKVHVRITKEDGSTFEKDIMPAQVAEYRKRYKTVVILGADEGSATGATSAGSSSSKMESANYIEEKGDGNLANNYPPYDKVTRGDVIAGALGKDEEGGKRSPKKKKIKAEHYSNWRTDFPEIVETTKAQKSVSGRGPDSSEGESKKKKKPAESECGCSHEVKESAETLAHELGGELVDIQEFKGMIARSAIKAFTKIPTKIKPLKVSPIKTAPLPTKPRPNPLIQPIIKPAPPGPLTKPKKAPITKPGTPGPLTKPDRKKSPKIEPAPPGPLTKPDRKTPPLTLPPTKTKTKTGILVRLDNKTGTISQVEPKTKTQTQTQTSIPPTGGVGTSNKPPGPGGRYLPGSPSGGFNVPNIIPKLNVRLPDPIPRATQFRV